MRISHFSGARTFLSALGIQCSYEHERTNAKVQRTQRSGATKRQEGLTADYAKYAEGEGRRTEGPNTDDRRRREEDGTQSTEDGTQMTEGGGQKTEEGGDRE